jgi:hypothetical protein
MRNKKHHFFLDNVFLYNSAASAPKIRVLEVFLNQKTCWSSPAKTSQIRRWSWECAEAKTWLKNQEIVGYFIAQYR